MCVYGVLFPSLQPRPNVWRLSCTEFSDVKGSRNLEGNTFPNLEVLDSLCNFSLAMNMIFFGGKHQNHLLNTAVSFH